MPGAGARDLDAPEWPPVVLWGHEGGAPLPVATWLACHRRAFELFGP